MSEGAKLKERGRMDVHESFRVQTSSMCSVGRWPGWLGRHSGRMGDDLTDMDRDREREREENKKQSVVPAKRMRLLVVFDIGYIPKP